MKTRREWIYQIRQRLRANDPDLRINNRMIANKLETLLNLLVRRDSDSRRVWKQTNLFSSEILEVRQVDKNRYESVALLPSLFYHQNGPFLQVLTDDGTNYINSTPKQQQDSTGTYFWIDNNKLILTQDPGESVTIRYWKQPQKESECQSELDVRFPVPDHLEEDLQNTVVQQLGVAPVSIPQDTNTNQLPLDRAAN